MYKIRKYNYCNESRLSKTKTKYKLLYMNVLEKLIKKLMTNNWQYFIDLLTPNFHKLVSL